MDASAAGLSSPRSMCRPLGFAILEKWTLRFLHALRRSRIEAALLFSLELAVVLSYEGFDFTGHGEKLFPLLLIERDWESAKPVDRHAGFLTDLDGG